MGTELNWESITLTSYCVIISFSTILLLDEYCRLIISRVIVHYRTETRAVQRTLNSATVRIHRSLHIKSYDETEYVLSISMCGVTDGCCNVCVIGVPMHQGKLENVREFDFSGKVMENAKFDGIVGNCTLLHRKCASN